MASVLRHLVSTNKRRYKDESHDLDLSYIVGTPVAESARSVSIVAFGYPAEGLRSIIRNPLSEVRSLFDTHYVPGRVCVFNLCMEPGWQYDAAKLGTNVVELPLWDGQAPPLAIMHRFCLTATAWLNEHPGGCVAVHCKAGKGRTGALVVALLMYLVKHGMHLIPEVISHLREHPQQPGLGGNLPALVLPLLQYWADKRTRDGKGLTISSQRRYVSYYSVLLQRGLSDAPSRPVHLTRVVVTGLTTSGVTGCVSAFGASGHTADEDDVSKKEGNAATTAGRPSLRTVPNLTIALWVRPPGSHTPYLAAYGSTRDTSSPPAPGAIIKAPQRLPVQVLPDGGLALMLHPFSTQNTTTGVLTPVVVPRISPETAPKSRLAACTTASSATNSTTSTSTPTPTAASQADVTLNAPSTFSQAATAASIVPTPSMEPDGASSLYSIPAPVPAVASTTQCPPLPPGMLLDGDFKIQVYSGSDRPTDGGAAFKSGGSLLYTWLHTAFLDENNMHAVHAMRPSAINAASNAPVHQDKSVRVEGGLKVLRVSYSELDKVAKDLRSNGKLSVQVSYY